MSNVKKYDIKGIIFDMGGVLTTNSRPFIWDFASKELGVSYERVVRAMHEEEICLEKGEETAVEYWRRVCKKIGIKPLPPRKLNTLWAVPYKRNVKINKDVFALIRQLSKKYPLAILSNTIKEHTEIPIKKKLYTYFQLTLFSYKVGIRKPERKFYMKAARELGISPCNLLFVDDTERMVRAARQYGFHAIRFVSVTRLKKDLKKFGVRERDE